MIRALTLADAWVITRNLRARDWWAMECLIEGPRMSPDQVAISSCSAPGMSWVQCDDERPFCMFGLEPHRPGVLSWWMLASEDAPREKLSFELVRFARKRCIDALRAGGTHRVQALVLEDWPEAVRMAEAIGLGCEGRLAHYGIRGEHCLMMARASV